MGQLWTTKLIATCFALLRCSIFFFCLRLLPPIWKMEEERETEWNGNVFEGLLAWKCVFASSIWCWLLTFTYSRFNSSFLDLFCFGNVTCHSKVFVHKIRLWKFSISISCMNSCFIYRVLQQCNNVIKYKLWTLGTNSKELSSQVPLC